MAITETDQTSMEEKLVDDDRLLELLSKRRELKQAAGEAAKLAKTADADAKAKLQELDLADGQTIRCGDFVVKKSAVAGREVAFTAEARSQLSIRFTGGE